MTALTSYRRLLSYAGALYVAIALLGRLPLAMSQMGTLLLVADTTGSYGAGGLAAGMLAVTNAVFSPWAGALADRHGQRPVVLVQSTVGGLGLSAIVLLAWQGGSGPALAVVAGAVGAFLPQVGPLARVRWRPILRGAGAPDPRLLETAFSYEGAADEASFVLGPAIIGVLIVVANPGAAVLIASGLLLVFGVAFALHHTAALTLAHRSEQTDDGRMVTGTLLILLLAQLLVGVLFGSVQTGTSALATAEGQPGLAGLVHAVLGVGSATAALAVAAVPERIGFSTRMLLSAGALLVLALPLLLVDSLTALVGVVLFLGCAVAPYMISNFMMAERAAPSSRVAAVMTLLAGATGTGYAVGSGLAGRLADHSGHAAAFGVTVGATVLALLVSGLAQPTLRPLDRRRGE